MIQITKTEADQVVEYFSSHGTKNPDGLIGDVLEKTGGTGGTVYQDQDDKILELYYKWDDCGVSKSLQQILEKAEREDEFSTRTEFVEHHEVLAPAAELFSFLHSLIPTKWLKTQKISNES